MNNKRKWFDEDANGREMVKLCIEYRRREVMRRQTNRLDYYRVYRNAVI